MRPFTMRVINSARSRLFSGSLLIMVIRQWREGSVGERADYGYKPLRF